MGKNKRAISVFLGGLCTILLYYLLTSWDAIFGNFILLPFVFLVFFLIFLILTKIFLSLLTQKNPVEMTDQSTRKNTATSVFWIGLIIPLVVIVFIYLIISLDNSKSTDPLILELKHIFLK